MPFFDRSPLGSAPAWGHASVCAGLVFAAALGFAAGQTWAAPPASAEQRTAAYFERVRADPNRLRPFLRQMPKGGDLHNHASGAIYAESYVRWATSDGLCLDPPTLAVRAPPCDASRPELKAALARDDGLHDRLVDAWSMRNRDKSPQSGHELFFDSFGKFGPATRTRGGDVVAEIVTRAAASRLLYVELMLNPDAGGALQVGKRTGWNDDLPALRAALLSPADDSGGAPRDLQEVVARARTWLDEAEARKAALLGCQTALPDPGCKVVVRYMYQVLRALPPALVYAQMVFAFELAMADSRSIGVNLVQPEDGPAALANFRLQMRMLDYLHSVYPAVGISLHAGELAPGLVPPEELRFHIRESVETGHATRIGHGVAVMSEDDPFGLLRELARRNVLVEICLTSNDYILGVRGKAHPLRTFLRFGVPVALATDDEGVSRSDITGEYVRAVEDQGLSYRQLKDMARASLEHAFVEGRSLWADPRARVRVPACARDNAGRNARPTSCRNYLDGNEKARLQMALEDAFADFEVTIARESAFGAR
jgi:adenosine deaminase